MKIYTKTGDDGTTGLIGGVRVKKSDAQIEAYGTVDELNSHLGLLRDTFLNSETQGQLTIIQNQLFVIGSHLVSRFQLPFECLALYFQEQKKGCYFDGCHLKQKVLLKPALFYI